MYIGIDLGTSGVKAILVDEQQHILGSHTESLTVSRPQPLWSEQDPEQWWQATDRAMLALGAQHDLTGVKALGLTGQMHGATLLDRQQKVLRPAILWNDGRSFAQCQALEKDVPQSRKITGNLMMPGFTAPKLRWVAEHEPDVFAQVDKVLLPKDYLRWRMTGDFATDMSDAAGTMWLDVGRRDWSDEMLSACGLNRAQMPQLFEGNEVTGALLPPLAAIMRRAPLASGYIARDRPCYRWVRPACILPSAMVTSAIPKRRYTAFVMHCPTRGI
jgi:xylulokinase